MIQNQRSGRRHLSHPHRAPEPESETETGWGSVACPDRARECGVGYPFSLLWGQGKFWRWWLCVRIRLRKDDLTNAWYYLPRHFMVTGARGVVARSGEGGLAMQMQMQVGFWKGMCSGESGT